MNVKSIWMWMLVMSPLAGAVEYHVSAGGDDGADGGAASPFRTISEGARRAQAGDVVTVHAGTYRERVNPPRGGESEGKRIVYQAAAGEKVVIKGSEVLKGWERAGNDTWELRVANSFFGDFNPFADLIRGDWFIGKGRAHHSGAVYVKEHWLTEAATPEEVMKPPGEEPLWFAQVGPEFTTIRAQFPGVDPNQEDVEVNVRQAVFYPDRAGVDFLTVRGFTMMHAATPWAPPTAEQVGLLGTHWSKGWIIENNDIRYSTCTGVTLGKYGDEFDNTSADSAEGYVKTIERAHERGWDGGRVGHHVVRGNRISHCEQAGIVGSLGAVFCEVTGNEIHDIHVRRQFAGYEQAGIKFHAAIDTEIRGNLIYRTVLGIWLDWMSQGTRVTRNVMYENGPVGDLFMEVNHGPFMVDHNVFGSGHSLLDMSEGGAYAHNLFVGVLNLRPEMGRETPYHPAHSTEVAGLGNIPGGDDRFHNNVFVGPAGLSGYDGAAAPVLAGGNVFLKGAKPLKDGKGAVVDDGFDPEISILKTDKGVRLRMRMDPAWSGAGGRELVTTAMLGKAMVPGLPYQKPDGSDYRMDRDWFGGKRDAERPFPGPFAAAGEVDMIVWPLK